MCGRFALAIPRKRLEAHFNAEILEAPPRYNIAPREDVLAIVLDGRRQGRLFKWGLIPPWADDDTNASRCINARAETVAAKPSFRDAARRRRCLVPASGFFEWRTRGTKKLPHYVHLTSGAPLALGGIWELWRTPSGALLRTLAILTCPANPLLAAIHPRMPVIVPKSRFDAWLSPNPLPPRLFREITAPAPSGTLRAHQVSTRVNKPDTEGPSLILPLE